MENGSENQESLTITQSSHSLIFWEFGLIKYEGCTKQRSIDCRKVSNENQMF